MQIASNPFFIQIWFGCWPTEHRFERRDKMSVCLKQHRSAGSAQRIQSATLSQRCEYNVILSMHVCTVGSVVLGRLKEHSTDVTNVSLLVLLSRWTLLYNVFCGSSEALSSPREKPIIITIILRLRSTKSCNKKCMRYELAALEFENVCMGNSEGEIK